MKKLLLSALFAAGALTNAFGANILIGDAKDDAHVYVGEGLSYDKDANMGVALRIPARTLQAYAGAKIVGLQIAAGQDVKELEIDAFLSKGQIKDGTLVLSEPELAQSGWIGWIQNESSQMYGDWDHLMFTDPYTIPAASDIKFDLYFGFYMSIQAHKYVLGISALNQSIGKNKVYITASEDLSVKKPDTWQDITTIPGITNGNIAVCAIVELPEEVSTNAMSFQTVYTPHIGLLDNTVNSYVYLTNDGPTEITSFEVTTTHGDQSVAQVYNFPDDEPMPIGYVAGNRQAMPIPVPVLGTGAHTMTITKVNGEENLADPEAAKHEFNIIGVSEDEAKKHRRRPVVEQYLAEDNHKSGVYQDDIILPSLEPYKGYCTYLPQHSNDKFGQNPQDTPAFVNGQQTSFTLTDADRLFINLVGDINMVQMPSQTIDRSIQMQEIVIAGKTQSTVTSTLYPQAMIYYMNEALNTPTFASVELSNTYNANTNSLKVEASGSVADVLPAGEKARLVLYLIEEGVESDSQEFPDDPKIPEMYPDGIFTHARVVRQMITSFDGDELEPGEFVKDYTIEIENPRWEANHMKVIAVVQRPMTNDLLECNIINSAEEPISPDYEEFVFSSIDEIEATAASTGIYDLQGRRLTAPIRGINIINGKKILIK
ncbi:MAG: Omp28-related outer membrane protein [Muribaculaceae bacterium]|nr:Omp28-related outer membrane protein [Muribaculaceae bacterium]